MQAQGTGDLGDADQVMAVEILENTLVDLAEDQGIVKEGCADADGARAGNKKLQGIRGTGDTPLADDGNPMVAADLMYLMHLEQGDGFDGGSGESALVVADHGHPLLDVNGHAHEGIDSREGIATRLQAGAGIGGNVRLVGRELGDEGLTGGPSAGGDHLSRHPHIVTKGDPTLLDVGARDIDFDGVDGTIVEAPGDFIVFLDTRPRGVGNEPGLTEIQGGQDVLNDAVHPRILQADRVDHAPRGLADPMRGVTQSRGQGRPLEADGSSQAIGEALDAGILLAKTHAPGQQHERGREVQTTKVDAQSGVDAAVQCHA